MNLSATVGEPIFHPADPAYVTTDGVVQDFDWGRLTIFTGGSVQKSETTVGICLINPGRSNPLHYHPNCEETLYVLSGRCAHRYGEGIVTLEPGQTILVPRYVVHNAAAIGDDPLKLMIIFSSGEREAIFLE